MRARVEHSLVIMLDFYVLGTGYPLVSIGCATRFPELLGLSWYQALPPLLFNHPYSIKPTPVTP